MRWQTEKEARLQNLSIPTIPSKFLQPNLDEGDEDEEDASYNKEKLITKALNPMVKIMVDNRSILGPGSYEVS